MLHNLLNHCFDRKWVCAEAFYPNPEPQTFPGALFAAIMRGGEVQFIG